MSVLKDYSHFLTSLSQDAPAASWPEAVRALWYDAKGDWEASHNIAQDMMGRNGSWIHAYLHRKEGDAFNAGYWYRQAGKNVPTISLEAEHRQLVEYFLKAGS